MNKSHDTYNGALTGSNVSSYPTSDAGLDDYCEICSDDTANLTPEEITTRDFCPYHAASKRDTSAMTAQQQFYAMLTGQMQALHEFYGHQLLDAKASPFVSRRQAPEEDSDLAAEQHSDDTADSEHLDDDDEANSLSASDAVTDWSSPSSEDLLDAFVQSYIPNNLSSVGTPAYESDDATSYDGCESEDEACAVTKDERHAVQEIAP